MASVVLNAGSPLDNYLRDEGEVLDESDPRVPSSGIDGGDTDESGDTTQIVSSNTSRESTKSAAKMDTWTGVLPSTPGPSAQTLPGEYPSDSLRDEAELFHDVEAVSERFKYLICSSGLLEKDWVAGFGGTSTSFGGLDLEDEPVDPIASRAVKPLAETKQSGLWVDVLGWATKGKERWDMVIAGVVLSIAISILLGPAGMHAKYNIILGLIGVTVLSSLSCIQWLNSTTLQEQTAIPSVPNSSPQLAALNSLVTLLASSQNLDLMIGTSISILQPHASTSTNVDLRLAVHHLTDEMTDHLASATSHLLQLVDRDELTVLSEMYDIPVAGTLYYSRKPRQSENDEDSHLQPSIPSPRRLLSHEEESRANRPAYEGEEAPLFGASAPVMSTSQSLPGPTCPQNHSDHPGIISSTLYTSGQAGHPSEDRFTTIPSRKPRLSKRSSWDSEVWSKSYSRDGLRRPSNDRRITEADEEDQEDEGKTSWASGPKYGKLGDHAILTNLSGSPSLRPPTPYTPSRTSPLSRIMSKTPDHPVPIHIPVTTLPTGLFSSPIIMDKSSSHTTSSNSKRRSLQDMPYYHTTNEDPVTPSRRSTRPMAGADLGRTMSLPTSDLQELRTKSATGLRRSSLAYAYQSFSSTPPARLTRVPSVSPLTAPGLKAACLGIHLKRRRMACCLLGLRFSSIALVEYWEEVKATIDELNDAIVEEREKLNRARERAEIEVSVAARLSRTGGSRLPIPIWPTAVAASTDFAPRTSDQQFVLERVDALHSALTKAWADLATIRQSLHEPKTLTGQWSNLREDLGSLLREWERGKDAVCRLSAPVTDTDVVKEEIEPHLGELPEFLDGWTDDLGTTPASFPRVDGLTLEAELSDLNALDTYHEDLPRPGVDQVYEATVLPIRRDQSALSSLNRDQRIRLTKEARGKGMSVGDMLVSEMGGTDAKRDKETRIRGSAVVLELKGMIGMIRRKKGQAEELDTKSVEVSHTPGQEVRTAQRDLALGDDILTNELQSKFVFPAFDRTRSMGE